MCSGVCHPLDINAAGQLKSKGIRVAALCPQFTETNLVREAQVLNPAAAKRMVGNLPLLTVDRVRTVPLPKDQHQSIHESLLAAAPHIPFRVHRGQRAIAQICLSLCSTPSDALWP